MGATCPVPAVRFLVNWEMQFKSSLSLLLKTYRVSRS